jgi:uncharacterized protein (TIGR03435 family)
MIPKPAKKLSSAKRMLRLTAIRAAVTAFAVFSLLHVVQARAQSPATTGAPTPSFEVASIKPNRSADLDRRIMSLPGGYTATNVTIKFLIASAYHVKDFQVSGGPSWINSERYDIEAKMPDSLAEEMQKLPPSQRRAKIMGLLLQSLLADRFKLKVSHGTKELPVYALVVAKNGPKLQESKPNDTYPNGIKGPDGLGHAGMFRMSIGGGEITAQGIPMASLVMMLSEQLGRTVLDQTGLKGNYDVALQWTPDPSEAVMLKGPEGGNPGPDSAPPSDSSGPSIFTAIQEQLGLRVESTKGPVDILVIDHVERPSEN